MPDRIEVLAVLRCQAHDDPEIAVAAILENITGGLAADRGLDRRVDISRRQAIASGALAVELDVDSRLAK